MHIVKTSLLAAALALAFSAPAFASSCPRHMAAIDAALAKNPSLSAEQLAEVKALRAQGEAEHKAGKHKESVESLVKAEKVLGL
jgi:hypothetical protein